MGAGLLRAVGLPEMVTESLTEYEAAALALARDPLRLAAIRVKLVAIATPSQVRYHSFARDMEAAHTAIWNRQHAGSAPETPTV